VYSCFFLHNRNAPKLYSGVINYFLIIVIRNAVKPHTGFL